MTETFAGFMLREVHGVPVLWRPDERFKTFRVSFYAQCSLDRSAAARAILPRLMLQGTARDPDRPSLARRMESLYGAHVAPSVSVVGAGQILKLSLDAVAGKFLPERPDQLGRGLEFLADFLSRPKLENGQFPAEVFARERAQLADAVRAIADNKGRFAAERALALACHGEVIGTPDHGGLEAIAALDSAMPEAARVEFLTTGRCWAVAMGALPGDEFLSAFDRFLTDLPARTPGTGMEIDAVAPRSPRRDTERAELQQSKLVMTFRIPDSTSGELWIGRRLFASLLGGGPHSRLFREVREKQSLAYYAQAQADLHKGLLVVQIGLDEKVAEQAEMEVLRQFEELRAGRFSSAELDCAKAGITSSLAAIDDSIAQSCAFVSDRWSMQSDRNPCEQAEQYSNATSAEVVAGAEGIWLDHVYLLGAVGPVDGAAKETQK